MEINKVIPRNEWGTSIAISLVQLITVSHQYDGTTNTLVSGCFYSWQGKHLQVRYREKALTQECSQGMNDVPVLGDFILGCDDGGQGGEGGSTTLTGKAGWKGSVRIRSAVPSTVICRLTLRGEAGLWGLESRGTCTLAVS